jgi:hypothetical protein
MISVHTSFYHKAFCIICLDNEICTLRQVCQKTKIMDFGLLIVLTICLQLDRSSELVYVLKKSVVACIFAVISSHFYHLLIMHNYKVCT